MSGGPRELADKARAWLSERALPLWTSAGWDEQTGTFVEALSPEGKPLDVPRRAMVQARQIYSVRTGAELGCLPRERALELSRRAAAAMIERWSLPSGAFLKSIDAANKPADATPDLYTQAFAMFGLAQAQTLAPDLSHERRALAVLDYLERDRRATAGGFTELEKGRPVLRSNPHMHLYEACLAWMEAGGGPRWRALADELASLCLERFVDARNGALAEVYTDGWAPERGPEGFFFEPGHHFEWAWLMLRHESLSGRDLSGPARALALRAESCGLLADGFVVDEVWCGGAIKKRSSRFWPQGERVKALLRLAAADSPGKPSPLDAADQALGVLFQYLDQPAPGLWSDQRGEDGSFASGPARASALYHIIGALGDYARLRLPTTGRS